MALPIRDGNQSLTTLSTILLSNAHIPAHTVVSLGADAITNIATAVSGVELGPNTLNALENITVTLGQVTITGGLTDAQLRASAVTIGGSVTATISGTASVTFGTAVITGSTSILNFPATQSVTFGTSVITGSTSIIGTASVTFSQAPVTFGTAVVTGSTSILNFPATQTVTFGTSVITGSVSVLNFPATQTVTFSQAPVTFGLIAGTVTANNSTLTNVLQYDGSHYFLKVGGVATTGGTSFPVYVAGTVTANPTGTQTIAGTVTANVQDLTNCVEAFDEGVPQSVVAVHLKDLSGSVLGTSGTPLPIAGTVTIGSALPAGTNRIGVVTIGAGTVTIGAGTAQIGSVTVGNSVTIGSLPSISGVVTAKMQGIFSGNYLDVAVNDQGYLAVVVDNQISISELPALASGTNQIGSVTASISNSVTIGSLPAISGTVTVGNEVTIGSALNALNDYALNYNDAWPIKYANTHEGDPLPISGTVTANTFAVQGTAVTTSNFTSTTASTVLAGFNATREVLTIFNEGAGNLHICAGATCTTIAYQVRLSAGDYYEVPNHQTTITHSAVFATAGTARVTEIR